MPSTSDTVPNLDTLIASSGLPRSESRILMAHASGRSQSWLIAHGDEPADAALQQRFETLVARRLLAGEPIAYLTGRRDFHGISLAVNPSVLIPRPETELLVDRALERLADLQRAGLTQPTVLDLGTGSGAITLAIAHSYPDAQIVATDRSAAALAQARANAVNLGLTRRIQWRLGAWWDALDIADRFHLIVSNPPYIAQDDPHLQQGDLRHEPIEALRSGADGLDDIRAIAAGAQAHLHERGWLMIEHGWDQGSAVSDLLTDAGFIRVQTYRDLEGRDRLCEGQACAHSAQDP